MKVFVFVAFIAVAAGAAITEQSAINTFQTGINKAATEIKLLLNKAIIVGEHGLTIGEQEAPKALQAVKAIIAKAIAAVKEEANKLVNAGKAEINSQQVQDLKNQAIQKLNQLEKVANAQIAVAQAEAKSLYGQAKEAVNQLKNEGITIAKEKLNELKNENDKMINGLINWL